MISLDDLDKYFAEYVDRYRHEYARFISAPPIGPSYPALIISPFLRQSEFDIYLVTDGVIINQINIPIERQVGSALQVDYEPTVAPKGFIESIKRKSPSGTPIGLSRIVSKKRLANKVWRGRIDGIEKTISNRNAVSGIKATFYQVHSSLAELVTILTFGAFCSILDIPLPKKDDNIGSPFILKKMAIFPADLNNKRFFEYLEIYGQVDHAAWDRRLINLRVKDDLRRDFAWTLCFGEQQTFGTFIFGVANDFSEKYTSHLTRLKKAIDAFREVLLFHRDETEDVFHELLETYPTLLDVYGQCESKPKLQYPHGHTSIIGKSHLEPDFIIIYPDHSYKIVELERASKGIATKQGQPRAEVTQATFQIAEWRHFIKTHYQSVKHKYPGIQSKCKSMIIMSRSRQKEFGGLKDQKEYVELLIEQFRVDEVLTYDDLFERACFAYHQLTGLLIGSI